MPDSTFDYTHARSTAARLIAKFGTPGTIRRQARSGPAYDPIVITTDYPCTIVVLDYEDRKVDGTLVRRTDKMIYLAAENLAITPTEADTVLAGEAFSIVSIRPLSPAGVTVFYEIQGRN